MKQETVEEAAERHVNINVAKYASKLMYKEHFIDGAKWQQERSYSEEEVMNIIDSFIDNFDSRKEWFKQFKKK